MKFLPPSHNGTRTAILWALLSQSIWLPVIFLNSQDQWTSKQRYYSSLLSSQRTQPYDGKHVIGSSRNPSSQTKISPPSQASIGKGDTGILLNSVFTHPGSSPFVSARSLKHNPSANSLYGALPHYSSKLSEATVGNEIRPETFGRLASRGQHLSSPPFFQNIYSRSELLGGTLTLQDLSEPIMPPIARAERAQWSRSGDPLAPLPEIWREPMRRALTALAKDGLTTNVDRSVGSQERLSLDSARFVHIPSSRIHQASEIPLALQADGSVDILNKPEDPVVIDEIRRWSAKQRLPEKGKISPAVVHLHPMEPLNRGLSQNDKPSSRSLSQLRAPEVPVPSAPAPEARPVLVPATTTGKERSVRVDPIPSISSAAPEPASTPEPVPSSKAES